VSRKKYKFSSSIIHPHILPTENQLAEQTDWILQSWFSQWLLISSQLNYFFLCYHCSCSTNFSVPSYSCTEH